MSVLREPEVNWDPNQMVEVTLNEPDDFLKVRETLTRIGVASRKEKKIYQSCHILHKQGRYFLVHFKELFALDGKHANLTTNDIQRRIWVHENGNGSAWTKKHNVIQRMNTINNQNNNFDELSQTLLMMNRYGIDNVRGSLFTSPFPLTDFEKIMAAQLYCEMNNLCRKCGSSSHYINQCVSLNKVPWVYQFGGTLEFDKLKEITSI